MTPVGLARSFFEHPLPAACAVLRDLVMGLIRNYYKTKLQKERTKLEEMVMQHFVLFIRIQPLANRQDQNTSPREPLKALNFLVLNAKLPS